VVPTWEPKVKKLNRDFAETAKRNLTCIGDDLLYFDMYSQKMTGV